MSRRRGVVTILVALSLLLLSACTLGTRPHLHLQIGVWNFQPSGPYVDDFVHLRAVDTLVGEWQQAHQVPTTVRPVLLWVGDVDGRTLSVVGVDLGPSSVTLQIDGEGSAAVIDRVIPSGLNPFVYAIVGKRADRLLVAKNLLRPVSVGGVLLTLNHQMSQPIESRQCELQPIRLLPSLLAYVPIYLMRTNDDRLARIWTTNNFPVGIDLCELAAHGRMPMRIMQVGSITIGPNLVFSYRHGDLALGSQVIEVTEFQWGTYDRQTQVSTVRLRTPSGEDTWSRPDPVPRVPGTPFFLPIRLGGVDYVGVTWPLSFEPGQRIDATTGVDRIVIDRYFELWRVIASGATVTFTTSAGVTSTRPLPP